MTEKLVIHRCGYYTPKVGTVNCLAFDTQHHTLAVLRNYKLDKLISMNAIEIWDASQPLSLNFCDEILEGIEGSVEALCFCSGRLFASHRDGSVSEYSLKYLRTNVNKQVSPCPLWCIASNEKSCRIAAGCDEGSIYILELTDHGFDIVKQIKTSIDSRLLCISWTLDGSKLVGGGSNCMQIWDAQTDRTIRTINFPMKSAKVGTVVWCLRVTQDFTIMCGDSRGVVSFWDGHTGTLINEHEMHKADVLAIACDESWDVLVAAGIDPKVQFFAPYTKKKFARIEGKREWANKEWNPTFVRRIHTHDVRSLITVNQSCFVSGGLDGVLNVTQSDGTSQKMYPDFQRNIHVASNGCTLLLQYLTSLQIWKLAEGVSVDNVEEFSEANADYLLEIRCKKDRVICCSSIHNGGSLVGYCDGVKTQFVRLEKDDQITSAKKVQLIDLDAVVSKCIGFNSKPRSEWALISDLHGRIYKLAFDGEQGSSEADVQLDEMYGIATKMCINDRDTLVALATTTKYVIVMDTKTLEVHCALPHTNAAAIHLSFSSHSHVLVLYCANELVEYDCVNDEYTEWSRQLNKAGGLNCMLPVKFAVRTALQSTVNKNAVLLAGDQHFAKMDRKKIGGKCNATKTFGILWGIGLVREKKNESAVVVCMQQDTYTNMLPPAFAVKTYGTG